MATITQDDDFTCAITQDQFGNVSAGFVQAPDGDLAVVSAADRLAQDVLLEFLIALGSNVFLPSQGSPSAALVGRVLRDPQSTYSALVDTVETSLVARHEADMSAQQRTKDSALGYFTNVVVDTTSALQTVLLSYTIVSVSGAQNQQTIGFATGGTTA